MRRASLFLVVLISALCLAGTTAIASAPMQRFFLSPSQNISCELDFHSGVGTLAFCETFHPARSVTMSAGGRLKLCTGTGCLGDPPETAVTLPYGARTRLGPFACASQTSGVRCTLAGSGRGFDISRSGITRIGGGQTGQQG